jgi:hypothetical protein
VSVSCTVFPIALVLVVNRCQVVFTLLFIQGLSAWRRPYTAVHRRPAQREAVALAPGL